MKKRIIAKEAQVSESTKIMNLAVQMPANKGELNRESMIHYVINNGTVEDQLWFLDLLDENAVVKQNNVRKGETYNGYDLYTVREEFCIHFPRFYDLSDKAKREKNKDTYFADALTALRAKLEAERQQAEVIPFEKKVG